MFKVSAIVVFLSLLLGGCGSTPSGALTESGRNVQVATARTVTNCEIVGKFIGENDFGSEEVATNDLRNRAGKAGADSVVVKDIVPNGKHIAIHGLAYKCQ
jgi:hypothetical protein